MKLSLLDFGEMDEEIRFDDAAAAEDPPGCSEELFIAKRGERRIGVVHERIRTTVLFAPPARARRAFPSELALGARSPASASLSTRGRPLQRALDVYYGKADSICENLVNNNRGPDRIHR